MNLVDYKSVIFDFDGVILDSNHIKKSAISSSIKGLMDRENSNSFVEYFVKFNGLPREEKIAKFFSGKQYFQVLDKYEKILEKELNSAKIVPGVREFIVRLNQLNKGMIVLSGGTEKEVINLLSERKLLSFFDSVHGGPCNKTENIKKISLKGPVLYFGDSLVDYKVSKENNFDFVLVYGYTNMKNWAVDTKNWNVKCAIKNFKDEELVC